jgi:hypothetical protein
MFKLVRYNKQYQPKEHCSPLGWMCGVKQSAYCYAALFLLLVTVFAQAFLPLVSCHLMPLSLLSAWHDFVVLDELKIK